MWYHVKSCNISNSLSDKVVSTPLRKRNKIYICDKSLIFLWKTRTIFDFLDMQSRGQIIFDKQAGDSYTIDENNSADSNISCMFHDHKIIQCINVTTCF